LVRGGSVGSSFCATMTGITEVNPMPPLTVVKSNHSKFFNRRFLLVFGNNDLPEKSVQLSRLELHKDGHDIPFEHF